MLFAFVKRHYSDFLERVVNESTPFWRPIVIHDRFAAFQCHSLGRVIIFVVIGSFNVDMPPALVDFALLAKHFMQPLRPLPVFFGGFVNNVGITAP